METTNAPGQVRESQTGAEWQPLLLPLRPMSHRKQDRAPRLVAPGRDLGPELPPCLLTKVTIQGLGLRGQAHPELTRGRDKASVFSLQQMLWAASSRHTGLPPPGDTLPWTQR